MLARHGPVSIARNGRSRRHASLLATVGGNGRLRRLRVDVARRSSRNDRLQHADVFLRDFPPSPRLVPPVRSTSAAWRSGRPPRPPPRPCVNDGWGPAFGVPRSRGAARGDYGVLADGCNGRCSTARTHARSPCRSRRRAPAAPRHARRAQRVRGFAAHQPALRHRAAGRRVRPQLKVDPGIGPPGIVVIATGTGFAPGTKVRLSWMRGQTPTLPIVRTDARGRFRNQVLVFHNDLTGPRDLRRNAGRPGRLAPRLHHHARDPAIGGPTRVPDHPAPDRPSIRAPDPRLGPTDDRRPADDLQALRLRQRPRRPVLRLVRRVPRVGGPAGRRRAAGAGDHRPRRRRRPPTRHPIRGASWGAPYGDAAPGARAGPGVAGPRRTRRSA